MSFAVVVSIGMLMGVTTVLFGFGGGFVAVPVVAWADASLGADAIRVAVASSALVMVVNAAIATATIPRPVLARLSGRRTLLTLLALGAVIGGVGTHAVPGRLVHWCFVGYLVVTILDLLVRPGFLRPAVDARQDRAPLPNAFGLPMGAVAAFLGVGGSVMTVPALRRAGLPMQAAATLANPLTLAIAVPAAAIAAMPLGDGAVRGAGVVGLIDTVSSVALLIGSVPVIVLLRRWRPTITERLHAWTYLALLCASTAAAVLS